MLEHDKLLEVLDYIPESGDFFWKVSPDKDTPIGSFAGSRMRFMKTTIKIDGVEYRPNQLAIFYTCGYWPTFPTNRIP